MKKEIFQEIEIPQGVEISIERNTLTVKGQEGEIKKTFNIAVDTVFEKKDNKIRIGNKKTTKREKKIVNTAVAHIKNMINGVQKKFEYKLKTVFSHFPITVEVKDNEVTVKNFLGEKVPRKCVIPKGAEMEIDKDIITIKSHDKEIAGQAAANLERVTKIRMKDRRIFQDGIYITNKAGREI